MVQVEVRDIRPPPLFFSSHNGDRGPWFIHNGGGKSAGATSIQPHGNDLVPPRVKERDPNPSDVVCRPATNGMARQASDKKPWSNGTHKTLS